MIHTPLDLSFLSVKWGGDGGWIWKIQLMVFSNSINRTTKVAVKTCSGSAPFGKDSERGGAVTGPPASFSPEEPDLERWLRASPWRRVTFLPAQAQEHHPNSSATLRSLVPGPPEGTRLAATPEGGGSGSGGAATRNGPLAVEGFRGAEGGRLPAARESQGCPRPSRKRWRRKKVTARGPARQLSPGVSGKSGVARGPRRPGPGRPRGASRR